MLGCVDQSTVSTWQAALDVAAVVQEKHEISHFSHLQPSHACELARHFRKEHGNDWDDAVKAEILEWVERVEDEGLTVQKLKKALLESRRAKAEEEIAQEDGDEIPATPKGREHGPPRRSATGL